MATVSNYRKSRRTRLVQRMDEASDPREAARLAAVIYKTCFDRKRRADGGPGSGNWGHESVPGYQGGSAPGGGVQNRQTTESGGYTSFSKMKAAAAKLHYPSEKELSKLPKGSVIYMENGGPYECLTVNTVNGDLKFQNEYGNTFGSLNSESAVYDIAEVAEMCGGCKIAIPEELNPNYNLYKNGNGPIQNETETSTAPNVTATKSVDEYKEELSNAFAAQGPKSYDNKYREQSGEIWSNLDDQSRNALCDYTMMGYSSMNNGLRAGQIDTKTEAKEINSITDAINQSEMKEDTVLYRGVTRDGFAKLMNIDANSLYDDNELQKLVGKTGTEDGFMSTGSSKGQGFSNKAVQMRILAPEGTKALYAEPFSLCGNGAGAHWDERSTERMDGKSKQMSFSSEDETIVQRGTSIQVISISYDGYGGKIAVDCAITGQKKCTEVKKGKIK